LTLRGFSDTMKRPRHPRRSASRRGVVLILFVLCIVILFSFLALAIDLGLLALARTQCQNAADTAAMAGARALNGNTSNNSNNNYAAAQPAALSAAQVNGILGRTVQA